MQFKCSSVRPSRSACRCAAAINRSMSAASTTLPSTLDSAVNVADRSRPQPTANSTLSTAVCAPRSACATASRTACSASGSANTVPLFTPREGQTPAPRTRTATSLRPTAARHCGTATITQATLLVPMSKRPMTSSERLLDAKLARTQPTPSCSRTAGHFVRRQLHGGFAPLRLAHQRALFNSDIDLDRTGAAGLSNPQPASNGVRFAVRRQLHAPAIAEPKHPSALPHAFGDFHAGHRLRLLGEQGMQIGRLTGGTFTGHAWQRWHCIGWHGGKDTARRVDEERASVASPNGGGRALKDANLEAIGKHALDACPLHPGQALDAILGGTRIER